MKIIPIKTKVFHINDNLKDFLIQTFAKNKLRENDIICITSKVISIAENQLVKKSSQPNKEKLIKKEADFYFGKGAFDCHLTIKHNILIPSAGIDESNSELDNYILYPKRPFKSAKKLLTFLKKKFNIKKLGIIITDSHTTPLRRGVTGISLSHWGFRGVESLVGKKDIFGRAFKYTYVNHADALASTAVYQMGESNETIPIVLLRGIHLHWTNRDVSQDCIIPLKEDIYLPILIKTKK